MRVYELLKREFIRNRDTIRRRVHSKHRFGLEKSSDTSGESKGARAVANGRTWLAQFSAPATDVSIKPSFTQQPTDRHRGKQAAAGRIEVDVSSRNALLRDQSRQPSCVRRIKHAVEVDHPRLNASLARRDGDDGQGRVARWVDGRKCRRPESREPRAASSVSIAKSILNALLDITASIKIDSLHL